MSVFDAVDLSGLSSHLHIGTDIEAGHVAVDETLKRRLASTPEALEAEDPL